MLNKNIKVLAIDPGYDRLGVAIIEMKDGKEKILFSDCFLTKRTESEHERLHAIATFVKSIIKKHKPEEVAIEKLFFVNNQKTGIAVAKVVGIISYLTGESGLTINEYAPTEIKLAIASHGRADKKDIHLMVSRLVELPKRKMLDDEVDAVAIGLTHLAYRKSPHFIDR